MYAFKFISLMIGANNFCTDMCFFKPPSSILDKHKNDMLQVLRTLRDNLPRTFVAVIPPPHLKNLANAGFNKASYKCLVTLKFECPCIFGQQYVNLKQEFYDIMRRWQELEMEIANYPEFNTNDFAVVAQPVLMNTSAPLTSDGRGDVTYFSVDCFHLTQKSHALFAAGLWNNLMEPCGTKSRNWTDFREKFICPSIERPYLATMLNSKKQNPQ